MITPAPDGLRRVTLTLDAVDVDLLDRLAALEGLNRSAELRTVLHALRPTMAATVDAFEKAKEQRTELVRAASELGVEELQAVMPEVERLHDTYLGVLARFEGVVAAAEAGDPRPSNHGGHTPNPSTHLPPLESGLRDDDDGDEGQVGA